MQLQLHYKFDHLQLMLQDVLIQLELKFLKMFQLFQLKLQK